MSINNPGDGAGWFYVSIEHVSDGVPCGTLQNRYQTEPLPFRGLDQLFRLAQTSMDELDFPQNSVRMRRFTGCGPQTKSQDEYLRLRREAEAACRKPFMKHGTRAAFEIRVYCRANASWQGSAVFYHNEHRGQLDFRSVLELMLAMQDEVVNLETEIQRKGCGDKNACRAAV